MEDSQKKNGIQKRLFDEILKKLPPRHALVDAVSDLLDISSDAAYRRIRGDKTMDLAESALLARHFGVSFDAMLGIPAAGAADFSYTPLDLRDPAAYLAYMKALADRLERLAAAPGAEIILSAVDVPIFHFMPYKELTLFKLFAWTNGVYGAAGTFEDFARAIETPALLDIYRRITAAYRVIPSREIWTEGTIDTFLQLVKYNHELGSFSDPATARLLGGQFLDMLGLLQRHAEKGSKTVAGHVPFQLYLSEMEVENNFILLRSEETMGCILKLFTINSLYIADNRFCTETLNWLDQLARRSTLISVASERERHKFFSIQQHKVRSLTDLL